MSNSQNIIPRPINELPPSTSDLVRDAVFLEDFHNGFLSRDVTTATLMLVRQKRHALMSTIHSLLNDFVKDCYEKNGMIINNDGEKNGNVSDGNCCWADVRPYGSFAIGTDLIDSDIDLYVQTILQSSGCKEKKICKNKINKKKDFYV